MLVSKRCSNCLYSSGRPTSNAILSPQHFNVRESIARSKLGPSKGLSLTPINSKRNITRLACLEVTHTAPTKKQTSHESLRSTHASLATHSTTATKLELSEVDSIYSLPMPCSLCKTI